MNKDKLTALEKRCEKYRDEIAKSDKKLYADYDKYLNGTTYQDRITLIGVLEAMIKNLEKSIEIVAIECKGIDKENLAELTGYDRYEINRRRREIGRIKRSLAEYQ